MHKLKPEHVTAFKAIKTTKETKVSELKADTGKKTTVSALADRVTLLEEYLGVR